VEPCNVEVMLKQHILTKNKTNIGYYGIVKIGKNENN